MDPFTRLERIWQEISEVEEEKLQTEQRLGLFFEHVPSLDDEAVEKVVQEILNQIIALKERKQALLLEQRELIVGAAAAEIPPPNPAGAV